MDYITRNEFEALKEEVRQLKEQRTEEIKAVKVEVASKDVIDRIDKLEHDMHIVYNNLYNTLQDNHDEYKKDLETLADTMQERFESLLIKYLKPSGNGH